MYWDTQELPRDEQFSYWADVVCEAFTPLAPVRTRAHLQRSEHASGMPGWVRSARLATTNCAEIASCTQRLVHGRSEVRRAPEEVVFVNLQLAGTCHGEQDGRRCVVEPGTFAVFDTTRPYTLEFTESPGAGDWQVLSFRVPREQLFASLPVDAPVTGVTVDARSGPGLVAASMMTSLWSVQDQLDTGARAAMDRAYGDVLATALGAFDIPADGLAPGRRQALRVAASRFVADRLTCGRITAQEVAAHLGISVRSLHQLYTSTGTTFAAGVRDQRLRECARELALSGRSIAEIAYRWGFCDGAHLSRLFRRHFGCTPIEYREQHAVTV
ncbi:helix-turn-helix domain-containing protein [Actinophytocola sp.]|uniref:helix-turn-helix domain-containing protein n=1 Tax=Actinophytocola sp. TaxID=1872138 RepID=UPI002ED3EDAC